MKLFHILRADGTRWFGRRKMWAAIIGIAAADYLMLGQDASAISVSSVLDMVYLYIGDPFFILCLMLSATVMGTSYCDERETGCFFLLMNRCSRKKYIISKIIHTFFSALFVLTAGTFLWICRFISFYSVKWDGRTFTQTELSSLFFSSFPWIWNDSRNSIRSNFSNLYDIKRQDVGAGFTSITVLYQYHFLSVIFGTVLYLQFIKYLLFYR